MKSSSRKMRVHSAKGRYDRLKLISWWKQKKIASWKVMVIGAGALGNEVLKNLALIGCGHIYIVDFDNIEASNLTRAVLFRAGDIGQPKAQVAAQRLKELNPDISVGFLNGSLTCRLGIGAFRHMDIVIAAVDNFAARLFINRACFCTGTPWINGGIIELNGEAHCFIPGKGACFECNLPAEAYQQITRRISCSAVTPETDRENVPTTPTIASLIAAIQIQEALKLRHGIEMKGGSGLIFNGNKNRFLPVQFSLNPDCLCHEPIKDFYELEYGAADITIGELLEIGREKLGEAPSIYLDFDLISSLDCNCGYKKLLCERLDCLSEQELTCPNCGRTVQACLISTIDKTNKDLIEKKLSDCGIPPWHIITLKSRSSSVYFVLEGDKNSVFSYSEGG